MSAVAKLNARGTPTPAPIPASKRLREGQNSWCVELFNDEIELDPLFEVFEFPLMFAVVLGTFKDVGETPVIKAVVEFVCEDSDFNVAFRGSAK